MNVLLEFPPRPKFLPVITRPVGAFVVRIYNYAKRQAGSQWGWSVYRKGTRIGYGLRATIEGAEAAAARSITKCEAKEIGR